MAYSVFTLAEVYKKYPSVDKVNFVVSRKQKVTHHINEFHEEVQKLIEPPLKGLMGELIPGSMEDTLPLQSADLLCWHFQRYYAKNHESR
jgi:hypothetical protein